MAAATTRDDDPATPLAPETLCPAVDADAVADAARPRDAAPLLGQDRAVRALDLGTRMRHAGFNVFVLGPEGAGRHSAARRAAEAAARQAPAPDDWCYVHDFETEWKPRALRLPAGRAVPFRDAVEGLIERLRRAIPALFETEDYRERRRHIDEAHEERAEERFRAIRAAAEADGIGIMRTPMGFAFAPIRDGEVVKPDAFAKLPEAERERIQARIAELQERLADFLRGVPEREHAHREEIRALNAEMASTVVDSAIAETRDAFADVPAAIGRLDEIRRDLIDKVELFVAEPVRNEASPFPEAMLPIAEDRRFRRYLVNVVVANGHADGPAAPVVYEDHPTLARLVGRIEHVARMGALETDFSMIRGGALHRANGGFLLIDAHRLLREPWSWEALKRALRSRRVQITSPGEEMSLLSTVSLEPEPIPLDLRVILVGERLIYYLLVELDPEFGELFKVQADFEDSLPRAPDTLSDYAGLVRSVAAGNGLRPPDAAATARAVVEAARMAGDAERLTLNFGAIADLLREADFRAQEAGRDHIADADLCTTIDERTFRADRLRARWHERIARDIVLIDTEGSRVGQINGLSVMQIGGFTFGAPTRITARVRTGGGRVVDIERESKLGGPIHSKGVLILSGYLAATYASGTPMSLWASLVFEQSYGGVEGDSASSAELYALLSALARVPLRQDVAVTGSVNQHGDVQAIGGVNEKIEGFFDICAARGLTGTQGVLIPAANVKHLVLRPRVVDAARAGRFAIWPVRSIDQGIALLAGRPAGARGADGRYPEGSVNAAVEARLTEFARARKAFAAHDGEDEAAESGNDAA
ncbi:AAA family ATPase [Aquibium sp. A9E412]|uniref:Lon protease family protein n=1 Tax=Aquibium sp. A9E412 TaxID=2976767 RepID=UPI0025B1CF04|nr:AAA family ATPase [Aquibium sp. A9E412]MDN2566299.1 AAA family ATPase [Aquibium sp. A9E412]